MKSTLLKLTLALSAVISSLLILTVPAMAQQNDIIGGLCAGANFEVSADPSSSCRVGDATSKFNDLVKDVINLISAIVGVVAVVMIIVGGLRYITSGGNDASVTGAKNTILYAIIGLIIVALAQLIVRFTLNKIATA